MNQYQFFQEIGFASGQHRKSDSLEQLMLGALDAQLAGLSYPAPEHDPALERTFARQRPVLLKDKINRAVLYVDEALMVTQKFFFGSHKTKTDQFKVVETAKFIHWFAGHQERKSVFERFDPLKELTDTDALHFFTIHTC